MRLIIAVIFVATSLFQHSVASADPAHGIAMHGTLKHASNFRHFSYVNPSAPKGGSIVLGVNGSFDSTNPLIVQGVAAAGLREYVFESLMTRALDEPFSLYGLVAEKIETPEDRSWVEFTINPKARFSDGTPLTVDDVIFSHALLRDKGRPNHRSYYSKVSNVEKKADNIVRFALESAGDREMPLILGLMPILPRHLIDPDTFDKSTLKTPVGSGPYKVAKLDPGKFITYERNPDYWGKDLPGNKGRFNFDEIRYDYYRDENSMFQAFKKGLYHFRNELDPGRWALGYKFPAIKDGRAELEEFDLQVPAGMTALVFNTRRQIFADKLVRDALTQLLDFEWINKNLYHGLYSRTQSYFERSELSSFKIKADNRERDLLAPFPKAVSDEIMEGAFQQPVHDGSGRLRKSRRKALKLLQDAGFTLSEGKLKNKITGQPFSFEILYLTRKQERFLQNFARNLKAVGIDVRLRQVDSAQYERRRKTYDFDMIQNTWYASLSPGNEQNFRWSSKSADTEGTFNFPGIKNPAVDAMIQAVLSANDRDQFVSAVRALDRILLSGSYVIPLFHLPKQWTARWSHLRSPSETSLYGFRLDTWWAEKAQ